MIEIAGGILLAIAVLAALVLFWPVVWRLALVAAGLYIMFIVYAIFMPSRAQSLSGFDSVPVRPSMCVRADGTLCQQSYQAPAGTVDPSLYKPKPVKTETIRVKAPPHLRNKRLYITN